jgi:hypothetical protein
MGGLYETGQPVCAIQRVRKHRVDYLWRRIFRDAQPPPIGCGLATRSMPGCCPRGRPQRRRGNTLAGHLRLERHAGKLASGVPQGRGVEHPPDPCLAVGKSWNRIARGDVRQWNE